MEKRVFRRHQLPHPFVTNNRLLQKACDEGIIIRLPHRWYGSPSITELERNAAQHGYLIGCCSAAKEWGLWVPETRYPHLICRSRDSSARATQLTIHRSLTSDGLLGIHPSPAKSPHIYSTLVESLEHIVRYHHEETGLIVLESALNQRKIDMPTADKIIAGAQRHKQQVLRRRIRDAQSGSETRVRNYLHSLRVPVSAQVYVPTVGRIDLLVGRSLSIECDSTAFHSKGLNVNEDRYRDAQQTLLGYKHIRLSYQQIWGDWENTKSYILTVLRTREHLLFPRPLL
ncbi:hypothetical protein [Arcanobacterium pinnipediorum]|uniref:DUF559 domain-containing protein n=1 Tax=Arcanobacterium pinnipediorum TaxID=1503041 RepID=A0ABY5AHX8_9ACTO|nr:hypothetical protein [Arcanobacterium pinnipediorum]USR79331.1 hypothetical protein NG665_08145 [Arcanobacterium pinnipediorum]